MESDKVGLLKGFLITLLRSPKMLSQWIGQNEQIPQKETEIISTKGK